jgi:hypothetical protein
MPRGLQHGCGQGRVSAAVLHFLRRLPACLPAALGCLRVDKHRLLTPAMCAISLLTVQPGPN